MNPKWGGNTDITNVWWPVVSACKGATMPLTDAGFQLLMSQFMNILTFLSSSTLQAAAADLTFNEMRALNSMRCAVNNMGENTWTFLAGTYYFLKAFLTQSIMDDLIRQYNAFYPLMCTCSMEADTFANKIGGNLLTNAVFSACSDESQILAVNQLVEKAFSQANSQVNPTSAPLT